MPEKFSFEILKKDKKSRARAGIIHTRRGDIETPYLVPIGTSASVKSLDSGDLENLKVQCILANTYHLHIQPGENVIAKIGGLHKFMNFSKPIFTDSGGFQVFSFGFGKEHGVSKVGFFLEGREPGVKSEKLASINEKGVYFKSIRDGRKLFMGPKESMKIQEKLDSDIIMAFDECTSPLSDHDYTKNSVERTHRWLKECLQTYNKKQAFYGIIQGGFFRDLRELSTDFVKAQKVDGIAIGGPLGQGRKDIIQVLDWVIPRLDEERPRHLLGIGEVGDIFECVERGIDTFDCVNHTRIARRGNLLISPRSGGNVKNKFRLNIKNKQFEKDKNSVDKNCDCSTCRNYSRAYLHHLYKAKEISYFRLATIHNTYFMLRLLEEIRESIKKDEFGKLKRVWVK